MRSNLLLIFTALLMTGCTFHQAPFIAYSEDVPLSETAVFSVMDDKYPTHHMAQVKAVDGEKTSCWEVGCPFWVRVLPGQHVFDVYFSSDHTWSMSTSSYKYVDFKIEVADMEPRHVYVVRYERAGENIGYVIEDLGENPDYALKLWAPGAAQEHFPVEF